jgi:hypothetical protein
MLASCYSHSTPGELLLLLHTLLCLLALNCSREHGTKTEKETKKVPGATATAMASKRRTSTRCVESSRNPASVLESSAGGSKSEPSVDQKVLHTSKCVQKLRRFPECSRWQRSFFNFLYFFKKIPLSSFLFFCFSSNFGYLKISQQFQSFQVFFVWGVLWCRLSEVAIIVFFHFLNVKNLDFVSKKTSKTS